MIPEAAIAMLSCQNRAVHSVVFGGFSPEVLAGRLEDCDSKYIITADEASEAARQYPKGNVEGYFKIEDFKKCVVEKNW